MNGGTLTQPLIMATMWSSPFITTMYSLNPWPRPFQIFIYKPDGSKIEKYDLCPMESISAHPDYCNVKMGNSWVRDMGDCYDLSIMVRGVGAKLRFYQHGSPHGNPATALIIKTRKRARSPAGWFPSPAPGWRGTSLSRMKSFRSREQATTITTGAIAVFTKSSGDGTGAVFIALNTLLYTGG